MNVANSLSDVRCSIMAHYSQKPFVALYIKLCVIARFIHLGLRYSYYLSDVYVKAKHWFDCSLMGLGGAQLFAEHVLSYEFS